MELINALDSVNEGACEKHRTARIDTSSCCDCSQGRAHIQNKQAQKKAVAAAKGQQGGMPRAGGPIQQNNHDHYTAFMEVGRFEFKFKFHTLVA